MALTLDHHVRLLVSLKIPPVSLAKVLYISKKYIAMKLTNVEVSNASGLLGDSFAYATND